jgi:hypothetical protein
VIFCAATVSEISVGELSHKLKELANLSRLDRDKLVVLHHSPRHQNPVGYWLEEAWYLGTLTNRKPVEPQVGQALLSRCRALVTGPEAIGPCKFS